MTPTSPNRCECAALEEIDYLLSSHRSSLLRRIAIVDHLARGCRPCWQRVEAGVFPDCRLPAGLDVFTSTLRRVASPETWGWMSTRHRRALRQIQRPGGLFFALLEEARALGEQQPELAFEVLDQAVCLRLELSLINRDELSTFSLWCWLYQAEAFVVSGAAGDALTSLDKARELLEISGTPEEASGYLLLLEARVAAEQRNPGLRAVVHKLTIFLEQATPALDPETQLEMHLELAGLTARCGLRREAKEMVDRVGRRLHELPGGRHRRFQAKLAMTATHTGLES